MLWFGSSQRRQKSRPSDGTGGCWGRTMSNYPRHGGWDSGATALTNVYSWLGKLRPPFCALALSSIIARLCLGYCEVGES